MAVLVETTVGDIVIDLFVKERPRCCLNFLKLCKLKYYNFCQFHAIEQNYIVQTGDPTGTGNGGESVFTYLYGDQARYFEPELVPKLRHTRIGIVSMVNNGANMLGSQFFITLGDNLDYLDEKHTIFGQVTEGLDTLEKLNQEICDEQNRPFRDIRIAHTVVLDDPFDDPKQLHFPSRSPSPTIDLLNVAQIALDQSLNEEEGKTEEEIQKEIEAKDMAAQAQILEMVGDLHYADEKPPDNVLFVCKLNPVTTDEDLEIIFSRFGKIKCCEVIRDRKTSASLQYAFIEFEEVQSCENAYFKMDNVLIDDRRIHVDFSQSVAKNYQWKRKDGSEKRVNKSNVAVKSDIEHKKLKMEKYSEKEKKIRSNDKVTNQRSRRRSSSPDYKKYARSYRNERPVSRKTHLQQRSRSRETRARQRSRSRETRAHHRSHRH
uniref:Peptidyl-prolyl cis-trans isomerase n=2 Tax=Wuchereria bancrofti TaxID=6293 RepID=A0A1I8EM54_WUCBA